MQCPRFLMERLIPKKGDIFFWLYQFSFGMSCSKLSVKTGLHEYFSAIECELIGIVVAMMDYI